MVRASGALIEYGKISTADPILPIRLKIQGDTIMFKMKYLQ